MNATSTFGFGILVLLFALPVALPNTSPDALTQAMIVVLGFMFMSAGENMGGR